MTDYFFLLYWCLCVSISLIRLLFHKQRARNFNALACPLTAKFLRIKYPAKNAGNGISRILGPLYKSAFGALTFLPVRTSSESDGTLLAP